AEVDFEGGGRFEQLADAPINGAAPDMDLVYRGLLTNGWIAEFNALDSNAFGTFHWNTSVRMDFLADPAANPLAGAFFNDGSEADIRARSENYFMDLGRVLRSALPDDGSNARNNLSFDEFDQVTLWLDHAEYRPTGVDALRSANMAMAGYAPYVPH